MKQRIAAALCALLLLLCTGCGAKKADDSGPMGELIILPSENEEFLAAFAQAPDYKYLGVGNFRDAYGDVRNAYVPYGGELAIEDGWMCGTAHGVSVRVSIGEGEGASAALTTLCETFSQRITAENEALVSLEFGEPQTADGDTLGVCRGAYAVDVDGAVDTTYVLLYADVRDGGAKYLTAEMVFNSDNFDDYTKALLRELGNCYGINMPSKSSLS